MTIKDIFDLRKQGKIEEAYEAIRARYATYRGKYTTLCMFWTARDIFNLRIQQGRTEEAAKIYKALQRVLPNINDSNGRAKAFMDYAHRRLSSPASAGSPSSFGSLHFSGEYPPAPTGFPGVPASTGSPCSVPAGSPSVPASTGSPSVPAALSVLSDSVAEK